MSVFVPTVGRSTGNVTTASSLPSEPLGGRMIADQRRSVDDSRATYGEPTASPCPGCSSRATVLDRGAKGVAGGEGQVNGEVIVDAGFTGAKPERPPGDLPDEGRTTAAVTVPAVSTMPAVTRSQRGGRAGDRLGPPSNSSVMRLVVRRTHGSRGGSGSCRLIVDRSASNLRRSAASGLPSKRCRSWRFAADHSRCLRGSTHAGEGA